MAFNPHALAGMSDSLISAREVPGSDVAHRDDCQERVILGDWGQLGPESIWRQPESLMNTGLLR